VPSCWTRVPRRWIPRLTSWATIVPTFGLRFHLIVALCAKALPDPVLVHIIETLTPALHTPRRVVSLQPSATVTLRDLGLLDRLVACTKYCVDVCPELAQLSPVIVSDSWSAQAEQISKANPDLVLASVPYQLEAVAEILKAGVRFLGLAPRRLADIYTDIAAIAGVMGASDRCQVVIDHMQSRIEDVRRRASGLPKLKVFCEEWGKPIIASQPWVAELIEAAGGEFIGDPGKTQTAEDVIAAQPDVVLAAWCGAGDRVPLERIVEQRGWENLPAARDRRIFCINDELLNTPASTLLGGLDAIAWALHSELFEKPPGIRQIGS
jgi:iron complex transport system substrate-binding protein